MSTPHLFNIRVPPPPGVTDALEIDGLVLRIDYLMRTLVNLDNHPQTDEIIRLLGEACNKLTREAQSRLVEEETVDFIFSPQRGI